MTKIPERYRKVTADQWTSTEGGEVREWESRKRATINQSKWNHFVSHFFQLPPNLSCCSPFKFRWPSAQISYPFFFSFLFSVLSSFYFSDSPRNQGTVEGMGFFFFSRSVKPNRLATTRVAFLLRLVPFRVEICVAHPFGAETMAVLRFSWVWLGFTEFHRVFLGFNGFDWVLLSFIEFYWVVTQLSKVLLGFTGFYWVLPGFTGFYWVLLSIIGFLLS